MSKILEVQKEASLLPESERAQLAAFLLNSLDSESRWVDDEEVARRSAKLATGAVKGLTREEFNQACGH